MMQRIFDNDLKIMTCLQRKECVKYLGVLMESNLSCRYHIDYISLKISKSVGIIAGLGHFVPVSTQSLF